MKQQAIATIEPNSLVAVKAADLSTHPAAVYLASLAPGSVPAQRSALNKIAEILGVVTYDAQGRAHGDILKTPWAELRYPHVQTIRARLQEKYNAATANRFLVALRRVLAEAYTLGQIPHDDYAAMAAVKRITVVTDDSEAGLMGRALDRAELANILGVCSEDKTIAGARDAAIISLGYGLGLRRAEIAKLTMSNYNREKNTVSIRGGKGNKSRTIPIANGAQQALEDWLTIRGHESGVIFYGINKGGNLSSKRLNVRAVDELFTKRANQAGVLDAHFHDLRRSFISDLLDQQVDVVTAAKLAGHADPETTARYDRRKFETRRKAIATLNVPYHRR